MLKGILRARWFVGVLGCVVLVGCTGGGKSGPPSLMTRGRVLENGQPVAITNFSQGYNCLQVDFYPVDATGNVGKSLHFPAFVAQDGSFTIGGLEGKGIPAGKYRVAIRRWDRTKTIKPDPSGNIDAWEGKFGEKDSPFIVDAPGPSDGIVIDLAKAPGTK
jgi:hypothetical protein